MTINEMNTNMYNIDINQNKGSADKVLEKLSALRSVDNSSPADLISYNQQQSDMLAAAQKVQNANETNAMLQISDSALQSLKDGAIELSSQSVARNNASLNSDQKAMIDENAQAIKESMQNTIEQTSYNGQQLLSDMSVEDLNITDEASVRGFIEVLDKKMGDMGAAMNANESEIQQYTTQMEALANSKQNKEPDVAELTNRFESEQLKLNSSLFAQSHSTDFLSKQLGNLLG